MLTPSFISTEDMAKEITGIVTDEAESRRNLWRKYEGTETMAGVGHMGIRTGIDEY